jgi:hypothetical protein
VLVLKAKFAGTGVSSSGVTMRSLLDWSCMTPQKKKNNSTRKCAHVSKKQTNPELSNVRSNILI